MDTITREEIAKLIMEKNKEEDKRFLIAIDGRSAAGKSSFADYLRVKLDSAVFHMDDFFLRPEQRTEERLATPGGNVDRERFLSEVLSPLNKGQEEIIFRAYDCKSRSLGEPVCVKAKPVNIIEGAYSCHPELWDYYDLHIFMDLSPEEQKQRILKRNGKEGWETFHNKWIPLEEKYLTAFNIAEKSEYYCI